MANLNLWGLLSKYSLLMIGYHTDWLTMAMFCISMNFYCDISSFYCLWKLEVCITETACKCMNSSLFVYTAQLKQSILRGIIFNNLIVVWGTVYCCQRLSFFRPLTQVSLLNYPLTLTFLLSLYCCHSLGLHACNFIMTLVSCAWCATNIWIRSDACVTVACPCCC